MAGPRRNAIENSSASTSSESRRLVDASRPNVARIYDTLLGSQRWPAVDQEAACELLRLMPDAVMAAHQNREFLRRAVRFLAGPARIRQFVDIGAGLEPSPQPVPEHHRSPHSETPHRGSPLLRWLGHPPTRSGERPSVAAWVYGSRDTPHQVLRHREQETVKHL